MNHSKSNKDTDAQWIKTMMEAARKEPSENLSHRIMHQIEMEETLKRVHTPQKAKQKESPWIEVRNIFGWMYLIIGLVTVYSYWKGGIEILKSSSFLWTCITIASVFGFFFLVNAVDAWREDKNQKLSDNS